MSFPACSEKPSASVLRLVGFVDVQVRAVAITAPRHAERFILGHVMHKHVRVGALALADNPILMRLRELELLEKVAASSNLNIVCGDGPVSERIMKLI